MEPTPNAQDISEAAQPSLRSTIETDGTKHGEQLDLTELERQINELRAEAFGHLESVCEAPEYKAVEAIGERDFVGYNYMAAYGQICEAVVRATYALPNEDARQDVIADGDLFGEITSGAPVLHQQGAVDLITQLQNHIDHISPKKRERMAQQPEKWNYAALAKQEREKFYAASQHKLLTGEPGAESVIHAMISATNMAAVYSLLGRKETEPLTSEQAAAAVAEFGSQLIKPVIEKNVQRPGGEGGLLNSILDSYRASFSGDTVDFAALQKLNTLAGDKATDYLQYLMTEKIVERACANCATVTDTAAMRETYFTAIRTLAEGDTATFVRSSDATLTLLDTDVLPKLAQVTQKLEGLKAVADMMDPAETAELIEARELNWEVLPPGEIETISREIVRQAQSETCSPTIDLERLKVLDNVRTLWGAENSYYARGALSARRIVQDGAQNEADQYLMLILQEKDTDGSVVAEHAIAESPIAGPNALYVFRQDVSEGLTWQDVMSLPKNYARELGARNVKHSLPRGETDLVGSMTEKVTALMTASPEEFRRMQFNGSRGFRFPRNLLHTAMSDHIN